LQTNRTGVPPSGKTHRRGTDPDDPAFFSFAGQEKLRVAQQEIAWLLERNYPMDGVLTFVGNRYQFSNRQRLALMRTTCAPSRCALRNKRMLPLSRLSEGVIQIDGFNLIILLETALSGGVLLRGMDGALRDLAGLRGTYHAIDKTDGALELLGKTVGKWAIPGMVFWLDQPVSNSGRLKAKILDHAENWGIPVQVFIVPNPDTELYSMERVVSGDSVILDMCASWFNLGAEIVKEYVPDAWIVDLSKK